MEDKSADDKRIAKFWKDYRKAVRDDGVKQKNVQWYVRAAEYYIKRNKRVKLANQCGEDVVLVLVYGGDSDYNFDMSLSEEFGAAVDMEVTRRKDGEMITRPQPVATEIPFTIYLNDHEIATIQCSPSDLKVFSYGFLFASCLLNTASEITSCVLDAERWTAHLETPETPDFTILNKRFFTSGCGKGVSFANVAEVVYRQPLESNLSVSADQISAIAVWLQSCSPLARETGGLHTAGLSYEGAIPEIMADDIGRHNAVDKVIGLRLLEEKDFSKMVLVCSGRISSEILQKAKRAGIEMIIARSAPTHQSILRARDMNVTVIGFARGSNFTIYTHPERVVTPEA